MVDLNRASLIGRIGKDPEIRRTQAGDPVVNFSVATSERWTDKGSGEKKERTEWTNIVIFGKLAGVAEKYLKKGMRVFVEGKLQTRKWQDKDGKDRYSTEVILQGYDSKMIMLEKKEGGSSGQENSGQSATASGSRDYSRDMDDEIPFSCEWR